MPEFEVIEEEAESKYSEKLYSTNPYVATYNNILTDAECKHFINISKGSLARSLVSEQHHGVISQGRTGSNTWIKHDHDYITKKVGERIAKIVGMPLQNAEAYQVIYYGITEEYRKHYDSWVHNGSDKTLRCMKFGGARLKTALCYLNEVEKGGGTKMTKLDITIPAEKGKLLIFQNTVSNEDHSPHNLAEHAGLPVEAGEKYAFNLWFRECPRNILYKDFNPSYYKNKEKAEIEDALPNIEVSNEIVGFDESNKLHTTNDILRLESYLDSSLANDIIKSCVFNKRERRDAWLKLTAYPNLLKKIEETTGISQSFYENINVVEYKENITHNDHLDAYDLNSASGKKYTAKLGQRFFTISLVLTDHLSINFKNKNTTYDLKEGEAIMYKNVINNSFVRDTGLLKSIVCKKGTGYIANIYIRYINKNNEKLLEFNKKKENLTLEISPHENYMDTLSNVLNKFKNQEVSKNWGGYKSFKYNFKGDFDIFNEYISKYNNIRDSLQNNSCLNGENLTINYNLDDELPLQIVENVLDKELLSLLQKYYKETIEKNIWPLGDKQSNRYKSHNEPMSRFLHYEVLPLIEKIVGKPLKPSYTYLSAYVKGADLPPHTDRADCEYTVSFIVDKPENYNWNIYVHKISQPVKHKGRYEETPPLEECVPVDCNAGGLMLFQGTDHIHFREKLEKDFYNILLLHYCSV